MLINLSVSSMGCIDLERLRDILSDRSSHFTSNLSGDDEAVPRSMRHARGVVGLKAIYINGALYLNFRKRKVVSCKR